MTRKDAAPTRKDLRTFGLTLGGVLALFAYLSHRKHGHAAPYYAAGSVVSLLVAAARPEALAVIFVPWMRVAKAISKVNTAVVLGLLYYVLLSPCAALARLLGYDPLDERWPDAAGRTSYWKTRPAEANEPAAVERQF